MYMPGVHEGPKSTLVSLELQLQTVLSYFVGTRNQIQVLFKNCMHFYPLRHLFFPHPHTSLYNGFKLCSASFIVWSYTSHIVIFFSTTRQMRRETQRDRDDKQKFFVL